MTYIEVFALMGKSFDIRTVKSLLWRPSGPKQTLSEFHLIFL